MCSPSYALSDTAIHASQKLDVLQEHITAMRLRCDEADMQLQATNEACKSLLDRAGKLREQRYECLRFVGQGPEYVCRQAVVAKQSIVTLFLARFTLSDDEVDAMTSRDVPVGKRFFDAMDKTQRIRDDCQVLMAGEEGPTKAG